MRFRANQNANDMSNFQDFRTAVESENGTKVVQDLLQMVEFSADHATKQVNEAMDKVKAGNASDILYMHSWGHFTDMAFQHKLQTEWNDWAKFLTQMLEDGLDAERLDRELERTERTVLRNATREIGTSTCAESNQCDRAIARAEGRIYDTLRAYTQAAGKQNRK